MIREVNKWRSGKNGSCLLVESLLVSVSFSHSNQEPSQVRICTCYLLSKRCRLCPIHARCLIEINKLLESVVAFVGKPESVGSSVRRTRTSNQTKKCTGAIRGRASRLIG